MVGEKFYNKYLIASARAKWWDYGICAQYFITTCTQNKEYLFGDVKNGKRKLSPTGAIVDVLWNNMPVHFPNIELVPYVIMPNHLHGTLILTNQNAGQNNARDVAKSHATSLQPDSHRLGYSGISPKSKTVSTIVRSYKPAVTKHCNRLGLEKGWQPRFYDRIIRRNDDYHRASQYIIKNPENWINDELNSINQ